MTVAAFQIVIAAIGSGVIAAFIKAVLDRRRAREHAADCRVDAAQLVRTRDFPDGFLPPSAALERPTKTSTAVVEPRDEDDPFCTCPACGLLGSHDLTIKSFDMAHLQCVNRLLAIRTEMGDIVIREPLTHAHDARFRALRDEFDKIDADRRELEDLPPSARRRTTHVRRECVFCEYVWHTDAGQTVS